MINCEVGGFLDGIPRKDHPIINKKKSETGYFKIFKCEDSLIRQSLLLQNCSQPLKVYLELIEHIDFAKIDSKDFLSLNENINKCFEQLELYCNNKLIGMIDFQKQFGQIQAMRQKILKEQKFIELFTDILKKTNAESMLIKLQENGPYAGYYKKINDIIIKIYRILIIICRKNVENQNLAYTFIDVYKAHANHHQIATDFIFVILDSNRNLLYSVSKPPSSLIEHYTWLLRINSASRKPHLLQFLQSICVYSDGGIKLTQEKIHEHLFGNAKTFAKAIISTISEEKTLKIILPNSDGEYPILLDSCFSNGDIESSKINEITYFCRMLELFANMCKERNYTCKISLKD